MSSQDKVTYIFSIILPRFEVENNNVRKKTFGSVLPLSSLGPSGPKKITVGCVILTVPRRNRVSHAVTAERPSASAEITSADTENNSELFVAINLAFRD
jgi:hypothetical protein